MGTSHSDIATTSANGPSSRRQSRRCTRAPAQPRLAAKIAGASISNASTPTPFVMVPTPAANQASVHMRQSGPRRKWRIRP